MLSIVVPVYNEEASLTELHAELNEVARQEGLTLDIVFVDDGSSDRSWELISQLSAQDSQVRGIRFRRNFGKAAALSAGFSAARGELVMTLDADLQDDPQEIPRFLEKMERDLDVVSGWKQVRHDPWHKVLPSRVFNWMVSELTGVHLHDHNCGFKCYRREIFNEVRLYGELHRFVPVLAAARGYRVGELVVQHRSRKYGYSKYGIKRFLRGFLDLLTVKFLTGFSQRPQHFLGAVGLFLVAAGMVGVTYLTLLWGFTRITDAEPVNLHQRPLLLYSLAAIIVGGQMVSLGFLAEMIIAYTGRDSDTYSIREETPSRAAQPASASAPHEAHEPSA